MKQDETAHRSRSAGCFSSTVFAARSERVQIDQDLVIRELAAIATIDIRKLFALASEFVVYEARW